MTERVHQPGDRVEWNGYNGGVRRGTVESIGVGKNDGIVMVCETGYAKSRPISRGRLRDCKTHTKAATRGGDVA